MASTSETGHAKNVANLDRLISFCTGYGATYHPANDALTVVNLKDLSTKSKDALDLVKTTKAQFDIATNDRQDAFRDLKPLSTRIINALTAVGANDAIIKDATTINKKIQGVRATSSKPDTTDPSSTSDKTISTSQQSYDSLIDHFAKLIELITLEPLYTPHEVELQITSLETKITDLKTKNLTTIDAYTAWSNARIQRNHLLYDPSTGLIDTAADVKKYVKSLYGPTSPEYKQVSGLPFKIP